MSSCKLIAVPTALAALALCACDRTHSGASGAGSRICTPFAEAANASNAPAPTPALTDPATALDDCLHRWAYTLAASTDPAEAVAQATVAACVSSLTRWNQQGVSSGPAGPQPAQGGAPEAPSLLTGQPTTPMAEHYTYAQGRALFYVVQARAGRCAPPASTSPAPANTAAR